MPRQGCWLNLSKIKFDPRVVSIEANFSDLVVGRVGATCLTANGSWRIFAIEEVDWLRPFRDAISSRRKTEEAIRTIGKRSRSQADWASDRCDRDDLDVDSADACFARFTVSIVVVVSIHKAADLNGLGLCEVQAGSSAIPLQNFDTGQNIFIADYDAAKTRLSVQQARYSTNA